MRVNIDYIPVIRQNSNLVKLERIEIAKPQALLSDLRDMMEGRSFSILDLQSRMCDHFDEDERGDIMFLSPNSYYSTYVSSVSFPHIYSPEKYEDFVENSKEEVIDMHWAELEKIREEEGKAKFKERVNYYLESKLEKDKREYYNECLRYIDAHSYKKTIDKCREDSSIKMHSIEEDGWNTYRHVINDDVTISVSTNFGYGNSTYFYLSLNYKGISILPYSFIVNYYHANMRDLCWFTRNYYAKSENWNTAFKFVEEITNLAATDTDKFCTEFLKAEIDKMLSGLSEAVRNPNAFLNSFVTRVNGDSSQTYIGIRNINNYEISQYRTYPEDMPIAFMAEKIVNSHAFLSNLSSLAEVYPIALSAVDMIKEFEHEALPTIQTNRSKNLRKIEECQATIQNLQDKIKELENKKAEEEKLIEEMYQKVKDVKWRLNFYREYEEEHPEYHQLKEDISEAEKSIRDCKNEIYVRKEFIKKLEECISTIDA